MENNFWSTPKSKSVGLFTELTLFYEALRYGLKIGYLNKVSLQEHLAERLIGISYIKRLESRAFTDLLRELIHFGFIHSEEKANKADINLYVVTDEGRSLVERYEKDQTEYFNTLLVKMQKLYVVPGWFISRLWKINPDGQGQIIIPTPPRTWNPSARKWGHKEWDSRLEEVTKKSFIDSNSIVPNSLPIELAKWIEGVKKEYIRLGNLKQKKVKPRDASTEEKNKERKTENFSPRRRLALAMREVYVKYLFPNGYQSQRDFNASGDILKARTYMAWVPRLEALGLLYYSDSFPSISGRLIFPVSVFRKNASTQEFRVIEEIHDPSNKILCLYQPNWENIKSRFLSTLLDVYQTIHNQEKNLYISLQDTRDEVCRRLRISALHFEEFLERAFRESLSSKINFAIALETDVREDQKSAYRLLRRLVFIQGVPHSLIAIKNL